jgi:hypothetical protein
MPDNNYATKQDLQELRDLTKQDLHELRDQLIEARMTCKPKSSAPSTTGPRPPISRSSLTQNHRPV